MRVLVCGGRSYADNLTLQTVLDALDEAYVTVVHGDAPGADSLTARWCRHRGYEVEAFPAEWDRYGKPAGPIRNKQMLDSGIDLVIAFPGGDGTEGMVKLARKAGVPVMRVEER